MSAKGITVELTQGPGDGDRRLIQSTKLQIRKGLTFFAVPLRHRTDTQGLFCLGEFDLEESRATHVYPAYWVGWCSEIQGDAAGH